MKLLFIALHVFALSTVSLWLTDFEQAKKEAEQKHELILLNFSGSDWCGPCMRMHKEIFNSEPFAQAFSKKLVMVNADFPRLKKNRLTAAQQKQNDMLAEKYNREGHFPFTVLLDAKGVVLKTWDGYPRQGSTAFMEELKSAMNDNQ
ncbi:MAG: thioredoxin family protein [Chitinophagaceae bacterium]|nr:thioredoxin family protein [Chitinophagaceae bacterium]